MRDQIKNIQDIFQAILEITEKLKSNAAASNWLQFQENVKQRQLLLEKFERRMQALHESAKKIPEDKKEPLRRQLRQLEAQFNILTKENSEVFDTIRCKKEALIDQFVAMNNGLSFLKAYEKKMMNKSLFSRTY